MNCAFCWFWIGRHLLQWENTVSKRRTAGNTRISQSVTSCSLHFAVDHFPNYIVAFGIDFLSSGLQSASLHFSTWNHLWQPLNLSLKANRHWQVRYLPLILFLRSQKSLCQGANGKLYQRVRPIDREDRRLADIDGEVGIERCCSVGHEVAKCCHVRYFYRDEMSNV